MMNFELVELQLALTTVVTIYALCNNIFIFYSLLQKIMYMRMLKD